MWPCVYSLMLQAFSETVLCKCSILFFFDNETFESTVMTCHLERGEDSTDRTTKEKIVFKKKKGKGGWRGEHHESRYGP